MGQSAASQHHMLLAMAIEKEGTVKNILDRVKTPNVSIGDASRCALISMDSTLKRDLTVGPPIDIAVYKKDEKKISYLECLNTTDKDYAKVCNEWSDKVLQVFDTFPKFDWE